MINSNGGNSRGDFDKIIQLDALNGFLKVLNEKCQMKEECLSRIAEQVYIGDIR